MRACKHRGFHFSLSNSCFIFKTASCTKADFNDIDKYVVHTYVWSVHSVLVGFCSSICNTTKCTLFCLPWCSLCSHYELSVLRVRSCIFYACVYLHLVCLHSTCMCVCVFLPSSKVSDTIINITGAFFLLCLLEISI